MTTELHPRATTPTNQRIVFTRHFAGRETKQICSLPGSNLGSLPPSPPPSLLQTAFPQELSLSFSGVAPATADVAERD